MYISRGVRLSFTKKYCIFCLKIFLTLINSVDPDEMPHRSSRFIKVPVKGFQIYKGLKDGNTIAGSSQFIKVHFIQRFKRWQHISGSSQFIKVPVIQRVKIWQHIYYAVARPQDKDA